jgi:hypothetical protein
VSFFDKDKSKLPIPALWGRDMLRNLDEHGQTDWHLFVNEQWLPGESVALPKPVVIEYNANKVLSIREWVNLIADMPEVIQPGELMQFRQHFDTDDTNDKGYPDCEGDLYV